MTDLYLNTEKDRQRLIGFIAGLDLSKPRKVAICEVRSRRSEAQNKLLWLWNGEIQRHLREAFGQICTSEEIHEVLVSKLWPAELRRLELPDGTCYRVGRAKTRKFNVAQMTTYLELLDAYCAESLGLLLPHPEDLMMSIYGQRRAAA